MSHRPLTSQASQNEGFESFRSNLWGVQVKSVRFPGWNVNIFEMGWNLLENNQPCCVLKSSWFPWTETPWDIPHSLEKKVTTGTPCFTHYRNSFRNQKLMITELFGMFAWLVKVYRDWIPVASRWLVPAHGYPYLLRPSIRRLDWTVSKLWWANGSTVRL